MKRVSRKGITITELVMYVLILSILFVMISRIFPYMGQTQKGMQRLDILHDIRNSSQKVADAISYSTKVIYPKSGDTNYRSVLGYLNRKNGLMVIFFDTKAKELLLWDCDAKKTTNIGSGNIKFEVKRKDKNYVSYKLTMTQMRDNHQSRDFSLVNSVNIRNDFR